jgi:hypothetical protein
MKQTIYQLNQRIKTLENRFSEMGYSMEQVVQSGQKHTIRLSAQADSEVNLTTALCVSTLDPWKKGRVRFYSPLYHNPKTTVSQLPFADPISNMGGFDDSGCVWVPPAGSMICLLFEQGLRSKALYIGTVWYRNRGEAGQRNWNFNIDEHYKVYEGHRKGYHIGPNDGSQVYPQWNTENYNGIDVTSKEDFESSTAEEQQRKSTYPNIYGFKTPEKHMMKMVDGDPKCCRRWKRLEILSSTGNWMIMKDDHLHPAGQWASTKTQCSKGMSSWFTTGRGGGSEGSGGDESDCGQKSHDQFGVPLSGYNLQAGSLCDGGEDGTECSSTGSNVCSNPYAKHINEDRPYRGPLTPQNNSAELGQSGIQLLSLSGHSFVMDDHVEQPDGKIEWEKSQLPFSFGCTDKFYGKMMLKSATGHMIELGDCETPAKVRAPFKEESHFNRAPANIPHNGIKLLTACGNRLQLNDHTINEEGLAGKNRGIALESTSRHHIWMVDEQNEQSPSVRREGGTPVNKSKKAFIQIRSGYGLEIHMGDDNDQEETQKQYIQIFAPQKDNKQRGPHIQRFQERPTGPGQIFLRAGGDYIVSTYDNQFSIIGEPDENPSDKIEYITRNKVVFAEETYFNKNARTIIFADEFIALLANYDCTSPGDDEKMGTKDDECTPCVYPVIVGKCAKPCPLFPHMIHWTEDSMSERVFASAAQEPCGSSCDL